MIGQNSFQLGDDLIHYPDVLVSKEEVLAYAKDAPDTFDSIKDHICESLPMDSRYFGLYLEQCDNNETLQKKKMFFRSRRAYYWDYDREITNFSKNRTMTIFYGAMEYLKITMKIQNNFLSHQKSNVELPNRIYHPLTTFHTSAQFYYDCLRNYFFPKNLLYALKNENGLMQSNSSKFEVEVVTFLEFFHSTLCNEDNICHAYSNEDGQKSFGPHLTIPDFCVQLSNGFTRLYWINGCVHHGCKEKECQIIEKAKITGELYGVDLPSKNRSYRDKLKNFKDAKKEDLFEYHEIWEHDWENWKLGQNCKKVYSKHVINFFSNPPPFRPTGKLSDRNCYKGAIIQVYRHEFDAVKNKQKIFAVDAVSQYASGMIDVSVPAGKVQSKMKNDLKEDLKYDATLKKYLYRGKKFSGSIHCRVVCPKNMHIPFLFYRVNDRSLIGNCGPCMENLSSQCSHETDIERSWVEHYCILDINYAVSIGYKVIEVFQINFYDKTSDFLSKFMCSVAKEKVAMSAAFLGESTTEEKESYCQNVNKQLKLGPKNLLKPEDLEENAMGVDICKSMLNHSVGKLGQKKLATKTETVNCQQELDNLSAKTEIQDFVMEGDVLKVKVKNTQDKKPNVNSNCLISAYVTSASRVKLHETLIAIEEEGGNILMVSTDSIYFSWPHDCDPFLPIGVNLGDYRHIYGGDEIRSFIAMGPKMYCVKTVNKQSNTETEHIHIGGLTSQQLSNVTQKTFEEFVDAIFDNRIQRKVIVDIHKQKKSYINDKQEFNVEKIISNNLSQSRRVVLKKPNIYTRPYGFRDN